MCGSGTIPIEAALLALPEVEEAAVVARDDPARLVAFVETPAATAEGALAGGWREALAVGQAPLQHGVADAVGGLDGEPLYAPLQGRDHLASAQGGVELLSERVDVNHGSRSPRRPG
mgnify:CR=1 FL=1